MARIRDPIEAAYAADEAICPCEDQSPGRSRFCLIVLPRRASRSTLVEEILPQAMAADACRADVSRCPGAECYICKNDKYWKGDLVRGCSCRGPHAGFVQGRAAGPARGPRGPYDPIRPCDPTQGVLWEVRWATPTAV